MITSSESVHVELPPADVFGYVADLRNEPAWHVDIASVPADTPAAPDRSPSSPTRSRRPGPAPGSLEPSRCGRVAS